MMFWNANTYYENLVKISTLYEYSYTSRKQGTSAIFSWFMVVGTGIVR